MPFFTPALVGGLASAIGAIGSGFLGIYGQSSANRANYDIAQMTNAANVVAAGRAQDFSAAQAQINRDFQERLSSTSWQRAVADMRKAGINPLLAVSQGGASTPSGSAPSGSTVGAVTGAPMVNKYTRAIEAFNSAMQAKLSMAQLDNLKETKENIHYDTVKKSNEVLLTKYMMHNLAADSKLKENSAAVARKNAENLGFAQAGLKTEEKLDESPYGQFLRALQRANPMINTARSMVLR